MFAKIHVVYDQLNIPFYAENRIQLSHLISEIFKKIGGHLLSGRTVSLTSRGTVFGVYMKNA